MESNATQRVSAASCDLFLNPYMIRQSATGLLLSAEGVVHLRLELIRRILHNIFYPTKGSLVEERMKMKILNESLTFSTEGEIDFVDLTGKIRKVVRDSGVKNGLVHVFAPHATGVIVLTEYESGLLDDIRNVIERLIPRSVSYHHPSNAHSHLRSMFLCPDRTLPIVDGHVALGTWQSLFFIETDVHPRRRTIIVQVLGE